ncbi:hypothetical protein [Corynebacterium belfantii]|uniref:hypothetical protein n=1 Tax=Corynebacterium belfantii TaxID=2014537 RepID=UPI00248B121A|nr:hypothetical protein [Corynebacterium belfantii]
MKNLDELAVETAKKLDIDQDAALDIVEHHLQQMEAEGGKKIDREQILDEDVEFLLVAMWNAKKAGDLGGRELQILEECMVAVGNARGALDAAISERNAQIVVALRRGARVNDVCEITGLTRQGVHNIKKSVTTTT